MLQSRFHLRLAEPGGVIFHQQVFAGGRNPDTLDSVDRMRVGDRLHKLLIERTLQPELLLNFRHFEGKQIIADRTS